ncbi:hypothetical protein ACFLXI_05165 [Chloroflexota bacterium]
MRPLAKAEDINGIIEAARKRPVFESVRFLAAGKGECFVFSMILLFCFYWAEGGGVLLAPSRFEALFVFELILFKLFVWRDRLGRWPFVPAPQGEGVPPKMFVFVFARFIDGPPDPQLRPGSRKVAKKGLASPFFVDIVNGNSKQVQFLLH